MIKKTTITQEINANPKWTDVFPIWWWIFWRIIVLIILVNTIFNFLAHYLFSINTIYFLNKPIIQFILIFIYICFIIAMQIFFIKRAINKQFGEYILTLIRNKK